MARKNEQRCEQCGCIIKDEYTDSVLREDGVLFCTACASGMMQNCSICGKIEYTWNMTSTDGIDVFCETCATALT